MNLLVLAFANEKNILLTNLENSLDDYGYNYKIIGEGVKWVNFMTKIQASYDFIKKVDYDIIAVIDAYDVLACDTPNILIDKFLQFRKNIVVGSENDCGGNCTPLNRYFTVTNSKRGRYNYANGGFYMGYREDILFMLKYILNLGIADDQIGLGEFMNEYPDNICLDRNGALISNVNIKSAYFDTYWVSNRVKNIKTLEYPCFIHTPSIQFDFYKRMDYFGDKILGKKYKRYSYPTKISNFYGKYRSKILYLLFVLIILILIIFLFLKYYE